MPLEVLDLYCGLGGWSKGFAAEGFNPTGVDIIDVGYPFKLILCDMREFDGKPYKGIDIIVGSPPCRDFSKTTWFGKVKWKDPPNPDRGLELVTAFLRVVKEAEPRYWLMENVPELANYFSLQPIAIMRLAKGMKRAFWGEFPLFLTSPDLTRPTQEKVTGRYRAWLRAEIPLITSTSLARSIKGHIISSFVAYSTSPYKGEGEELT